MEFQKKLDPAPAMEVNRPKILDVRSEADFVAAHRAGAVNIPLEELAERIHELPSPHIPLVVFDVDPRRARWARSRLRARGRLHVIAESGDLWQRAGAIESGPTTGRLWSPHALIERALDQIRPSAGGFEGQLALDIACGTGRDAVYLAMRGFSVQAWDILPDALERCRELARRNGVIVETSVHDAVSTASAFSPGPEGESRPTYDLITCFNFLHRPLMPWIASALRSGGVVVYETFTTEQRRRFGKPRREEHLLEPGELAGFFPGWQVIYSAEHLAGPRRFVASLIARKPGANTHPN